MENQRVTKLQIAKSFVEWERLGECPVKFLSMNLLVETENDPERFFLHLLLYFFCLFVCVLFCFWFGFPCFFIFYFVLFIFTFCLGFCFLFGFLFELHNYLYIGFRHLHPYFYLKFPIGRIKT